MLHSLNKMALHCTVQGQLTRLLKRALQMDTLQCQRCQLCTESGILDASALMLAAGIVPPAHLHRPHSCTSHLCSRAHTSGQPVSRTALWVVTLSGADSCAATQFADMTPQCSGAG